MNNYGYIYFINEKVNLKICDKLENDLEYVIFSNYNNLCLTGNHSNYYFPLRFSFLKSFHFVTINTSHSLPGSISIIKFATAWRHRIIYSHIGINKVELGFYENKEIILILCVSYCK